VKLNEALCKVSALHSKVRQGGPQPSAEATADMSPIPDRQSPQHTVDGEQQAVPLNPQDHSSAVDKNGRLGVAYAGPIASPIAYTAVNRYMPTRKEE